MKNRLTAPALLLATLLVPAALSSAPAGTSQSGDVRYCCTPQQIAICSAQGGTSTCRPDNVCRCLF